MDYNEESWDTIERPPLPDVWDIREEPLTGWFVASEVRRVRDQFHPEADGKRSILVHSFELKLPGTGAETVGKMVAVFGKPDLDTKLEQVATGDLCRVEYLGNEEISGGRQLAKFQVRRAAGAVRPDVPRGGLQPQNGDEDIPF